MAIINEGNPLNGTAGNDFIVDDPFNAPDNTLNGLGGDDLLLADWNYFRRFWEGDNDLTPKPHLWSTFANNEIINSTFVPHTSIANDVPYSGYVIIYELAAEAGARITLDVDHSNASTDTIVEIRSGDQNTVLASNDDGGGDIGSTRRVDSFLEYTFSTAGTYAIYVTEFGDNVTFEAGDRFVLNVSLTGQETTAYAQAGNDVLNGGAGLDHVSGGQGNDTLVVAAGDVVAGEFYNGGLGTDTILCDGGVSFVGTTIVSIEEIALVGSIDDKAITFQADQIGNGLASNLLIDSNASDTLFNIIGADYFRVEMGSATSVDLSAFRFEDREANDRLIVLGDGAGETIRGSSVRDELYGADGNDVLRGGLGGDYVSGGGGDDALIVATGDVLAGEINDGGLGTDTILCDGSVSFVGSTIVSIEEVAFVASLDDRAITFQADQIGNGLASNLLIDSNASDTLFNIIGADYFRVEMGSATSVDLSAFRFEDREANDRLIVLGDGDSETIRGSSVRDELYGLVGNDVLEGGLGRDYLSGGFGSDRATYANAAAAVVVNLSSAAVNTGEAAGDTYNSIESITGSAFNDRLTGTNGINSILGGTGADSIRGLGGSDNLYGNEGNDVLEGGLGRDYLSGGFGSDRATYANAAAAVVVNLSNTTVNAGEAAGDTYNSIEYLTGSDFNDSLTGDGGANGISGSNGADLINGQAGGDTIFGGSGNDNINGHLGSDTLTGNAGNDTFTFNTALGVGNIDMVSDFNVFDDSFALDNAVFAKIAGVGVLSPAQFVANAAGVATTANQHIIYDTSDGRLIYDSNGNAPGGAVVFAQLNAGLGIINADFSIF
jgi:Ca2+-binding RTX toxin-like protein